MTNYDKIINIKPIKIETIKKRYPFAIQNLQKDKYYEKKKSENKGFILDIYPTPLVNDDPKVDLLDENYFLFAHEYKFLNFFKEIFTLNDKNSILDFTSSDMAEKLKAKDLDSVLNTWDILDYSDKNIFLQLLLKLDKSDLLYYINYDFRLYLLISKLIYRNDFSMPDIIFTKHKARIFYTYGVSILLTIENREDFAKYEKIARKNELFLRQ